MKEYLTTDHAVLLFDFNVFYMCIFWLTEASNWVESYSLIHSLSSQLQENKVDIISSASESAGIFCKYTGLPDTVMPVNKTNLGRLQLELLRVYVEWLRR